MNFLLIILFSLLNAYSTDIFIPDPPAGYVWKQFFSDDFDGPELNMEIWKHSAENAVRRDGYWRNDAAQVDGQGYLLIKTFKDKNQYISGAIETKPEFEFRYGYFTAKVKTQKEKGQWSAFWLWPFDSKAPGAIEIDIFEYGFTRFTAQNAVHYYQNRHKANTKRFIFRKRDQWHTFSAWWKPDEVIFYKDGKETWRKKTGPTETPSMLIFSTEIAKIAAGDIRRAKLPDQWMVDWVKVYNLEPINAEYNPVR